MSTIHSAIIHNLEKEPHGNATIKLASRLLVINDELKLLVTNVLDLYNKNTARAYGKFDTDTAAYPTSSFLKQTFDLKTLSFMEMSLKLMSELQGRANTQPLATGAYVLMVHFTNEQSIDFFLVAMISSVEGSVIDPVTFTVTKSMQVDTKDLRMAGRVNISDWLSNSGNRYINFTTKQKISGYFKEFLACSLLIEGKEETQNLVRAVKQFAYEKIGDAREKEDFLGRVNDFCSDCIQHNRTVSLEALTNNTWSSAPEDLAAFLAEYQGGIQDGFTPSKDGLRSLKKLKATTQYWTLSIDRQAVLNGYAEYDETNKVLTLTHVPDSLHDELKNHNVDNI